MEHGNGRRPSRQSRPCQRRRTCNSFQPAYLTSTELRKHARRQVFALVALKAAKAKVRPRPTQKAHCLEQLSLHAVSGHTCFNHRGTTHLPFDQGLEQPRGRALVVRLRRRAYIVHWHGGTGNSESVAETNARPIPAGTCSVEVLAKASQRPIHTGAGPLEVPGLSH